MIPIRPEVGMYAAFARLNYKPWFAISEFVDNSIQSAQSNITILKHVDGPNYKLRVKISISDDAIEITDNAAGISEREYPRAFLPASPPKDTSGLSEYGLGMKAAASWFSSVWSVRTKAIHESVERTILFDIPKIIKEDIEELEPIEQRQNPDYHYTTVRLINPTIKPKGKTLEKIKTHLSSIYRIFLRDNVLELDFNGELLKFQLPVLLEAHHYSNTSKDVIKWKKELKVELDTVHRITGWAGILEKGSVSNAGFAVFRRKRLIQGSTGEAYRPEIIFGKPNMFVYQRLVGEIEVHGFSVSHTKDGIQWDEWEDLILSELAQQINAEPVPLIDQAKHHRSRAVTQSEIIQSATSDAIQLIIKHFPKLIESQLQDKPITAELPLALSKTDSSLMSSSEVSFEIDHNRKHWTITVCIIDDPAITPWYEISKQVSSGKQVSFTIRLNLAHPFLQRFISPTGDEVVIFTRLAAGLSMAEITAREIGIAQAGRIRTNLDAILREAFSGAVLTEKKNG